MLKIIFAIINSLSAILVVGFCSFGFMMSGGYSENIHTFHQIVTKVVLFPAIIAGAVGGAIAGWIIIIKKEQPVSKAWKILLPLPLFIFAWLLLANFF